MDTHIVHLSLIALALTAPKPPAVVSIVGGMLPWLIVAGVPFPSAPLRV